MTELFRAEQLTFSRDGRPILDGLDMTVAEGEVVGLVGPNGVGKSTLMGVIAADLQPASGEMFLDSRPYHPANNSQARQQGVGIIRQQFRIDPELTVAQAIFRESFHAGRPHAEVRRQARQLLREIDRDLDVDVLVGSLRRGEHAIVEAVRMLAEDAYLVIMDEVGATFDLREIDDLHYITSRLTQQGRGVIYISHRLREVKAVSDRLLVMRDGVIRTELDPYRVSTDDIAEAMIDRRPSEIGRRDNVTEDLVLRVRGLNVPGEVSNVDLDLHRGEVLGLAGTRHSGVYAIAGAIVGEVPSTMDSLRVLGHKRTISSPADAAALRIGYFSDDDDELGLSNSESIARTLMAEGWDEGVDFETEVAALREVIDAIQQLRVKTSSIRSSLGELSGGDRQKIALTRWMTDDRDILVLNEPTRGLDIGARADLLDILNQHTASGRSAIVIAAELDDLISWSDRIAVVREGELVATVSAAASTVSALDGLITPIDLGLRGTAGSTAFG